MSSAARADSPLGPVGAFDIHPGRDHAVALQVTSLMVLVLAVVVLDGLVRVLNGPGLLSQDLDQMVMSLVVGLAGIGNDTLIWPHRDGLIWPRQRHSGAVVTV